MSLKNLEVTLKNVPSLDKGFMPLHAYTKAYEKSVAKSGGQPLGIGIQRNDGQLSVHHINIHTDEEFLDMDKEFVERFVKFQLWMKGGYKVYICGSDAIANYIEDTYKVSGKREFDALFMERVFEKPFEVEALAYEQCPKANETAETVAGGDLDGCRIGFDAGGSDMKVCAVKDGEVLYSEEVVWLPKLNDDPDYHYDHIEKVMAKAASFLPQVDAIGISSAGVYVANRCMVASLFILIEGEAFENRIKDIYLNVTKKIMKMQQLKY